MSPKSPSTSHILSLLSDLEEQCETETQGCGEQRIRRREPSVASWSTCVRSEFLLTGSL